MDGSIIRTVEIDSNAFVVSQPVPQIASIMSQSRRSFARVPDPAPAWHPAQLAPRTPPRGKKKPGPIGPGLTQPGKALRGLPPGNGVLASGSIAKGAPRPLRPAKGDSRAKNGRGDGKIVWNGEKISALRTLKHARRAPKQARGNPKHARGPRACGNPKRTRGKRCRAQPVGSKRER